MITFLKAEEQHQHKNGGGWVANTAVVADSVYVGPNAQVLGDAQVYGYAQVFRDAQVYGNAWETLLCDATTDPGLYYLEHPMNVDGTAILIPGQYIGSHKTGLHKGDHALIQCGKLRVWSWMIY